MEQCTQFVQVYSCDEEDRLSWDASLLFLLVTLNGMNLTITAGLNAYFSLMEEMRLN